MDKIFYFHAGAPKTGTSSLGFFLEDNLDILKTLYNVHVPENGKIFSSCKHRVFNIFSSYETANKFEKELHDNSEKNFFMMDEGFYQWSQKISQRFIDTIKKVLPNHIIKIFYYIPRVDSYLKSWFYQTIYDKYPWAPNGLSYQEFCHRFFYSNDQSQLLSKTILKLQELFGKESLCLRIYDKRFLLEGDTIRDFCSLVSWNIKSQTQEYREHKSVNPELIAHISHSILQSTYGHNFCQRILKTAEDVSKITDITRVTVDRDLEASIQQELDQLMLACPQYHRLYEDDPPDIRFGTSDFLDYSHLFHSALLYNLISRVDELAIERYCSSLRAICKVIDGRECLFWGAGQVYQQQKSLFKSARPKAIVLDRAFRECLKPDAKIDGLPVCSPEEALNIERLLPVLIFASPRNSQLIFENIARNFPRHLSQTYVVPFPPAWNGIF